MASSFLLEKAYIYDPKNPGEPPAMGGVAGVITAPPPPRPLWHAREASKFKT
jgi:hypothetical protein